MQAPKKNAKNALDTVVHVGGPRVIRTFKTKLARLNQKIASIELRGK